MGFLTSSKAFGQGTLIGLQLISTLFLCAGMYLVTEPGLRLLGFACIGLFGLSSVQSAMIIRTSREAL